MCRTSSGTQAWWTTRSSDTSWVRRQPPSAWHSDLIVVIVFVMSVFSGMGVLVARFAGATTGAGVNRTVYQAFLGPWRFGRRPPPSAGSCPSCWASCTPRPRAHRSTPFLAPHVRREPRHAVVLHVSGASRGRDDTHADAPRRAAHGPEHRFNVVLSRARAFPRMARRAAVGTRSRGLSWPARRILLFRGASR